MDLIPHSPLTIGQQANYAADQTAQQRYTKKKAPNTKRRQVADLALFARYLAECRYPYPMESFCALLKSEQDLTPCWYVWEDITHGLVEGFVLWQESKGYAIGSINVRLSTIKTYCSLARRAGVLSQSEFFEIKEIATTSHKDGRNIEDARLVGHRRLEGLRHSGQ